jgi:pimeloyl-ACP methyl ester carboxylesterase
MFRCTVNGRFHIEWRYPVMHKKLTRRSFLEAGAAACAAAGLSAAPSVVREPTVRGNTDSQDEAAHYPGNQVLAPARGLNVVKLEVPRRDGTSVVAYVSSDGQGQLSPKPVILLLHGSGGDSVFARKGDQVFTPFLFGSLQSLIKHWNIVCIEKRGVSLGDFVGFSGFEGCSPEYIEYATREARIEDTCCVVRHLVEQKLNDGSTFLLIGHSEGSHVAAGMASESKRITHLALFPFSAGHGLFDGLVDLREQLKANAISAEDFKKKYHRLVGTFREIRTDARSKANEFKAHTYRRWASYSFGAPLRDLLKIDIPVFLGIGSLDQTAIGTDWVVAEFVKEGKDNLTYRNYVNYDHAFFLHGEDGVENRQNEVLRDLMEWVKAST